ncbi:hypothetical protein [Sphingobacterium suaedae]|uniref:Uncharacterized protein n=1 Tax=Sphingobacterium suaedae TaxID=1686402 RepID=A0ABW5KNR3_9SPHI
MNGSFHPSSLFSYPGKSLLCFLSGGIPQWGTDISFCSNPPRGRRLLFFDIYGTKYHPAVEQEMMRSHDYQAVNHRMFQLVGEYSGESLPK